jgi:hypothetical protein
VANFCFASNDLLLRWLTTETAPQKELWAHGVLYTITPGANSLDLPATWACADGGKLSPFVHVTT